MLLFFFTATPAGATAGGQRNFCVCHNANSKSHPTETIVVAEPALCTHITQHDDVLGPCSPDEADECKDAFDKNDPESAEAVLNCGEGEPPSCGEDAADIVLMLDRTGSVSKANRDLERDAARDFIDAIASLGNGSRIAIGRFGDTTDGGTEAEMRASLGTDYNALKTATTNALSSNSHVGTNLKDAINVAQKELDDNGVFTKQVIILLSDGDANEPGTSAQARAAAEAAADTSKGKGTIIITVAFDASASSDEIFRDSLARIATQPSDDDSDGSVSTSEKNAENGDGDYFLIGSGKDLKSIFLNNIFENIRCDDHDTCTADSCDEETGKCVFEEIPDCKSCEDDEDCSDGDACNGKEKCGDNGTCQAGTTLTCTDENACTANSCDSKKGCVSTPVNCSDGDPCTADSCDPVNGCMHDVVEGCKACEDDEDCDNGNVCDGKEKCGHDGTCQSGHELHCNDHNPCTSDSCDPVAGCINNGISCDDDNECTADSCDPHTGCEHEAVSCNDQNACTADSCDPDKGCVGTPVSCDDHNPCTVDSCDVVNGCQHDLIEGCRTCEEPSDCDNHNACDGAETCVEGKCESGTPPDCTDKDLCTNNSCDPKEGCVTTPVVCGDQNVCTDDSCDSGKGCVYSPISCDDENVCTADSCDEETGCGHDPISCDDQNACTADSCDSEKGCGHVTISCDDHNPCTADSCDEELGCQHNFIEGCKQCESDEECSNNNRCDGEEFCGEDDGICHSGKTPVCADDDACTVDTCDPIAGCLHNAKSCDDEDECTADSCDKEGECQHEAISCDDNDACTADTCDPFTGCGHTSVSCDDHNPCTVDSCDEVNGCQHVAIEGCKTCEEPADCDNHNACDGTETCVEGKCESGTPPNCEDSNSCTGDSCDAEKGCVHQPVSCEDQNACTADSCDSEEGCSNEPISCDDNNACTVDSCESDSGCMHQALNCDDEDECTIDSCDPESGCLHTPDLENRECNPPPPCESAADCNDEDECTLDICDPEQGCVHEQVELCNPPPPCPDADQDGVCDPNDNCVNTPNPNQEDDNHNGVGNACEQPGGDSGGVGGPGQLVCLQGSGVSGKANDPKCSGFACSLNRGATSADGTILGAWLLLSLGALTPWILLKRRVPVRTRRSR